MFLPITVAAVGLSTVLNWALGVEAATVAELFYRAFFLEVFGESKLH